ncbi:hypothetical protein BCR32DRAFT_282661 [Anaeromyces robustus]|uniref:Uncharacterized protein n=1 Tax=Anaeromyces robustus TaxID=1754192 RepID=A0A1Y1WXC8_9FUNG|nr:hypothetical protein BCR32DRAFT_282661 [Anaeromyces robustus]|eukprot:ORX78045.1 hypothetical protein BCR32DRAFT_282661 [Anaeromyces robustus]
MRIFAVLLATLLCFLLVASNPISGTTEEEKSPILKTRAADTGDCYDACLRKHGVIYCSFASLLCFDHNRRNKNKGPKIDNQNS